jgi:hypothetical protein
VDLLEEFDQKKETLINMLPNSNQSPNVAGKKKIRNLAIILRKNGIECCDRRFFS